ncbi:diacylglycerol kinase family protein [Bacillus sp. FJAT-27445]|uniref:diacylglycerol/lipid kinase family protein n=1 Tax=Bacillus sp. FJAT-27445 TaxID=1679166 RepID=UPI0007435B3C|nr:diacylglycerol kinase family protein [Bacillus sp. FJAT-27445]
METFYFIVNPKAGNGRCLAIWKKVEKRLKSLHIPYRAFFTEYRGHAIELSREAVKLTAGRNAVVAAVGGDGTAHEVLNGIGHSGSVAFGFIPAGSGNDFSRGYKIASDPIEAMEDLLRNQGVTETLTDCGSLSLNCRTTLFINNAGAGFDALVSKKANESRIKSIFNRISLGKLVYVYILLKELITYKRTTIRLTIDGRDHIFDQAWFVTVSNQPFYGGGMIISPKAKPDDGELDVTVVHHLSKKKLLLVFISVFWGKHIHFKEVHTFRGRVVSVQTSFPIHFHADGEYLGMATTEKIKVIPHAVRILARQGLAEDMEVRGEANGIH